jgi:hypothetical protein
MSLRALIAAATFAWGLQACAADVAAPPATVATPTAAPTQVALLDASPGSGYLPADVGPRTFAPPAMGGGSSGHLSVRGPDILDPSGRPILLRGWNWGHWGKAQENDAAANAAQGANAVRIPLRWWGFYQGRDIESRNDNATATAGIDPEHLRILDGYVQSASRAHLWIILFIDSNCGQNGLQNGTMIQYCDPQGQFRAGHNFFTDRDQRARFINVWRFIAARYKDVPYMGMFEPMPEPGTKETSPAEITQFYTEVMDAIRQVAPGIPFLLGGQTYKAQHVTSVYNPNWHDVVYTGNLFLHHQKGPEAGVQGVMNRLQQLLALRQQRGVPIFVQQVGVRTEDDDGSLSALKAVLGALVQNRVGFTYWEYRGSNNPGEYGALIQEKGGGWIEKTPTIQAVSAYFRN